MSTDKLDAALSQVDWAANVKSFSTDTEVKEKFAACNLRLAIWSKQLEDSDNGNPALTFIREMQMDGQLVVALVALALYKPAANSIRTLIETALYYTYFRTHRSELATLLRNNEYFIDKGEIISYHKLHTVNFTLFQEKLGLLTRLKSCYGPLSAIVHGQVPGMWHATSSLRTIAPNRKIQDDVISKFTESEETVHRLFLATVAPALWDDFSTLAKKALLKGLPGDVKEILKLDEC